MEQYYEPMREFWLMLFALVSHDVWLYSLLKAFSIIFVILRIVRWLWRSRSDTVSIDEYQERRETLRSRTTQLRDTVRRHW